MTDTRRLPHASGANVDEPHVDVLLQLTYEDGVWGLQRAWLEDGQLRTGSDTPTEIPFAFAQKITEVAGTITAEVVRHNHVMWAEALEARELAEAARERENRDARIERVQQLLVRLGGREA